MIQLSWVFKNSPVLSARKLLKQQEIVENIFLLILEKNLLLVQNVTTLVNKIQIFISTWEEFIKSTTIMIFKTIDNISLVYILQIIEQQGEIISSKNQKKTSIVFLLFCRMIQLGLAIKNLLVHFQCVQKLLKQLRTVENTFSLILAKNLLIVLNVASPVTKIPIFIGIWEMFTKMITINCNSKQASFYYFFCRMIQLELVIKNMHVPSVQKFQKEKIICKNISLLILEKSLMLVLNAIMLVQVLIICIDISEIFIKSLIMSFQNKKKRLYSPIKL